MSPKVAANDGRHQAVRIRHTTVLRSARTTDIVVAASVIFDCLNPSQLHAFSDSLVTITITEIPRQP